MTSQDLARLHSNLGAYSAQSRWERSDGHAALLVEKHRIEMEEQVKGAAATSATSEATFPDGLKGPRSTPEVPASEAGTRWMATK